jgi:hypothetical protein
MHFPSGFGQHDENDDLFYVPSTAHNLGMTRFYDEDIIQYYTGDGLHTADFVNWPYYVATIMRPRWALNLLSLLIWTFRKSCQLHTQ